MNYPPITPDSYPVVIPPTGVTHWSCPEAPSGWTHHITATGKCYYCHVAQADLIRRQTPIWEDLQRKVAEERKGAAFKRRRGAQ